MPQALKTLCLIHFWGWKNFFFQLLEEGNSSNLKTEWDRGFSMPGAFKLDHLQPLMPLLLWYFCNFFTFILGGHFLLLQLLGKRDFSPFCGCFLCRFKMATATRSSFGRNCVTWNSNEATDVNIYTKPRLSGSLASAPNTSSWKIFSGPKERGAVEVNPRN